MKFGPVPVSEAKGSILAHSLGLPTGRLRKGLWLTAAHVETLQEAGCEQVIVAQLEAGDIDEDSAATRLAEALLRGTSGLKATPAATGRVNIIAESPGVAHVSPRRVEALNSADPMISFATVPEHHQMAAGTLLGTVKIISYAVAETALKNACAAAEGAIGLHKPLGVNADLIISQVERGSDESKAIAATRARLEALEANLAHVTTVPHAEDALCAAIKAATSDLVIILTGSATSDPHDVAPQAVRLAGGTITRFGMPVDPGNLLFLGHIGAQQVLGLPGCARSLALNGADLVLSRLLCGLDVTSRDIAGMGVGGLLKEIPTRPRPRRG